MFTDREYRRCRFKKETEEFHSGYLWRSRSGGQSAFGYVVLKPRRKIYTRNTDLKVINIQMVTEAMG